MPTRNHRQVQFEGAHARLKQFATRPVVFPMTDQFTTRRVVNWWESLCETQMELTNIPETADGIPLSIPFRQPPGQVFQQGITVTGALLAALFFLHDLAPDEPVGDDHAGVDRAYYASPRLLQNGSDAIKQPGRALGGFLHFILHPSAFILSPRAPALWPVHPPVTTRCPAPKWDQPLRIDFVGSVSPCCLLLHYARTPSPTAHLCPSLIQQR
jgi:hypothetical protein